MRSHTKIYLEYFGYSVDPTEYKPCEICSNPVVDVHHIDARKMGGSKLKDYIENLMGCCRDCHNDCEKHVYTKEWQLDTHADFMQYYNKHGKTKIQNLRKGR